jgi:DNA-binding NarL/FixJ family response regulator
MPNGINLAIIDDHTLFRTALTNYLSQQSNLQIIAHAPGILELLKELKKVSVDILLMDAFLPDINGQDALRIIRSQYPDIKVIILSMSTSLQLINDFIDIGIHAYISKADEPENLLQAIYSVSENRLYRNKLFTEALYLHRQETVKNGFSKNHISFDERQKRILQLLWEEKSNKDIANELFLSVRSIEKIRQDMKEKLEVKSTIGLLKFALSHDIIKVLKVPADVNKY